MEFMSIVCNKGQFGVSLEHRGGMCVSYGTIFTTKYSFHLRCRLTWNYNDNALIYSKVEAMSCLEQNNEAVFYYWKLKMPEHLKKLRGHDVD